MSNKILKVALVGCGGIANSHALAYKHWPNANLIAVCDINEELGKAFKKKHKVEKYFSDYQELLEDPEIEMVDLCTPPNLHKIQIKQAFGNNKHVLVEKPPVLNLEEMDEVIEAYNDANVKFSVIHNQRFEKSIIDAKKKISNGDIGEIIGVDIFWQNAAERDRFTRNKENWCHQLPGGRWEELMPHYIYLSRYFIGEMMLENVSISGKLKDYPWMICSDANITLSSKNKKGLVNLRFTQRSDSGKQILITIYGTKGHIYIERQRRAMDNMKIQKYKEKNSALYLTTYEKKKKSLFLKIIKKLEKKISKNRKNNTLNRFPGHTEQIRQSIDALLNDKQLPVSIDEAYEVMKLTREIGMELGHQKSLLKKSD